MQIYKYFLLEVVTCLNPGVFVPETGLILIVE